MPPEKRQSDASLKRKQRLRVDPRLFRLLGAAALAALLALVSAAPLGSVIEPGEEKTKPPWMFLPLYPFEDWLGIKALLYMPIVGFVALALVPFVDRWRSSSFRRRWPLLLAGALVIVALVALALYALASTPAEHIPGMGGE